MKVAYRKSRCADGRCKKLMKGTTEDEVAQIIRRTLSPLRVYIFLLISSIRPELNYSKHSPAFFKFIEFHPEAVLAFFLLLIWLNSTIIHFFLNISLSVLGS